MNGIIDYLSRLFGSLRFWIVILPWQQGLRVRAGRYVRLLRAGVYLKLPVLDVVQVESVRRRTSMCPTQTLTTSDGVTVTLGGVVGYAIGDLEQLYRTLHHAEDTIAQTAQGVIAGEVIRLSRSEIEPLVLNERVNARMQEALCPYGLVDVSLQITDFAFVRAIRLIQDKRWSHGRALDTSAPSGAPQ